MKPPLSRYIALAQRRTMVLMSRRGPLLENKDGEKKIAVPPSAPGAAWTGARYHEHHHGSTLMKTASIIAAASALLFSGMAEAVEIRVLSTQATQEAYLELVAQFEKATGHKVATVFTGTLNVQKRLADGEAYDLIIMAGPPLDARNGPGQAGAGRPAAFAENRT